MEKVKQYQQYILQVLQAYAALKPANIPDLENLVLTDEIRGQYQLVRVGWNGSKRVYHIVFHIEIKENGKIWIQQDWTEQGVANELVEMGVPKSDIVLAYHAPSKRTAYGFAAA